jgi:uncharacterized protein
MSHGTFVWNELMTHDLAGVKRFYSEVVGWTFDAMPMKDFTYWIIKMGDKQVGGIFEMHDPALADVPDNWLSYIAVDDVDARLKKATAAGASVMREPFDVLGVGRIAILRQVGGAMVAWMTPKGM